MPLPWVQGFDIRVDLSKQHQFIVTQFTYLYVWMLSGEGVCVCVCVDCQLDLTLRCHPSSLIFFFWDRDSLWLRTLTVGYTVCPVDYQSPTDLPDFMPVLGLQEHVTMESIFIWVLRLELRSLCLQREQFINWAVFLSLPTCSLWACFTCPILGARLKKNLLKK